MKSESKQFPKSKARWWNDKSLESSEPPSFQRWQHDRSLDKRFSEVVISGRAMAALYGDNSLGRHVEKLLDGIHEFCLTS